MPYQTTSASSHPRIFGFWRERGIKRRDKICLHGGARPGPSEAYCWSDNAALICLKIQISWTPGSRWAQSTESCAHAADTRNWAAPCNAHFTNDPLAGPDLCRAGVEPVGP